MFYKASDKPTAPPITENELGQAPEHQNNSDEMSSNPLEDHHENAESTLIPSKETGESQPETGEKHDEVPVKKTPPLHINDVKLSKDDQPIKLIQLEASKCKWGFNFYGIFPSVFFLSSYS